MGFNRIMEKICSISFKVGEFGLRMIGPAFVLLGFSLVSYVFYVFYSQVLFGSYYTIYSAKWWTLAIVLTFFGFNIFFNYASCVLTHPGAFCQNVVGMPTGSL
jgi:hypothetical protein